MVDLTKVDEIVDRHCRTRQKQEHVIGILLDCQDEFRYLPRPLIEHVAARVDLPVSTVLGIATFYRGFSLKPVGKYPVAVCTGTACHVLGAQKLVEAFSRELGVERGDTTADGLFSLHTVNCPGCCGLAPVVTIGQDVHGKVTQAGIPRLLKKYGLKRPGKEA